MDTSITKLLGEGTLPQELVTSLQEAFDKKVAEARQEAEEAVREEFSGRYEHDKANLVEAMDRMLTDVVTTHNTEHTAAVQKFVEARTAFRKAVKESRKTFSSKLNENLELSRQFVTEQLKTEISKLREQKKTLVAEQLATAGKLQEMKRTLASEQGARLRKIDEFVVGQVRKEMTEFNEDHRALVATRAKLVAESRSRLRETQTRFVKEAAKNVEQVISETLTREMTQLHGDLERNRQNMFGRRMFEAFAAEYLTSYLAEGTEIRTLQNVLESKEAALSEATTKLNEAVKESQQISRKAKVAEDRATRARVTGELLSNLRGEKRTVMEGMLETVKTEALRETFTKLLPVVLDETYRRTPAQGAKKTLAETPRTSVRQPTIAVSGENRGAKRLFESAEATNNFDSDIAEVVRLAGIQK